MSTQSNSELLLELGDGDVKVGIYRNAKGYLSYRPVRGFFWKSKRMKTASFNQNDLDELIYLLRVAKTFDGNSVAYSDPEQTIASDAGEVPF